MFVHGPVVGVAMNQPHAARSPPRVDAKTYKAAASISEHGAPPAIRAFQMLARTAGDGHPFVVPLPMNDSIARTTPT